MGAISSATTITLTFTHATSGCTLSDTQRVTVVSPKPAPNNTGAGNDYNEIKVYPNPSAGTFTLEMPPSPTSSAITVMDIAGHIIAARISAKQKEDFDIGAYPRGLYLVKVRNDEREYVVKVLLE